MPEGRFVIEQAPIRAATAPSAASSPRVRSAARAAGRFRLFRYEVRRWRDGVIPDVAEAVESPQRLSDDPDCARRLLELVPQVPTPVWGRDELRRRRDVELELADLLADRAQRPRRRVDPPSGRRTGSGLAGRHRRRAPPAGTSALGRVAAGP